MIVCLWSGKLGFESLSGNLRAHAGSRGRRECDAAPQSDISPTHRLDTALTRRFGQALLAACVALILALAVAGPAEAAPPPRPWGPVVTATWYGPGFYGNSFACEGRDPWTPSWYRVSTRGIAHRSLPCGTQVTIRCVPGLGTPRRCHGRTIKVRVIDRGPYSGATWDLTGRSARDLCACEHPYTMRVRSKRGWA